MIKKIYNNINELLQNSYHKGFFHLLSANIFIQISGFASQLLVSWLLTPKDIGIIKFLQTYSNLFSILATGGLNTAVLKLCSEKRELNEKIVIYKTSLKYMLLFFFLAAFSLLILLSFNILTYDIKIKYYFLIYIPIIFAISYNSIQNSFLQALKLINSMSKAIILSKLTMSILIIALTYFLFLDGYVIATFLGSFLTLFILSKNIKKISVPNVRNEKFPIKPIWYYSKYSLLANFAYTLLLSLDIIFLNIFIKDKNEIGYYSFALLVLVPYEVLRGTIIQITTPYFSEKGDDRNKVFSIFYKYQKLFVLGAFFITIISIFILPPILNFIFSFKYEQSNKYIIALLLVWFLRSIYTMPSQLFIGVGKIYYNFYPILFLLVIHSIMIIILVKIYYVMSVAISLLITEIVAATIAMKLFNNLKKVYANT